MKKYILANFFSKCCLKGNKGKLPMIKYNTRTRDQRKNVQKITIILYFTDLF